MHGVSSYAIDTEMGFTVDNISHPELFRLSNSSLAFLNSTPYNYVSSCVFREANTNISVFIINKRYDNTKCCPLDRN